LIDKGRVPKLPGHFVFLPLLGHGRQQTSKTKRYQPPHEYSL
jgi:hypothetical protein